ncbi:MAG: outer membrane protein transport protein [Labilithrix sp.]|nr:outer membrane protein transport protein [Labilithrix sp.]
MHGRVSVLGAKTTGRDLGRTTTASASALAIASAMVLDAGSARAGGFEIPDNGAQAMGRGAAFVAKADDGSAIYHNPAGLARQRGTHLLLNGNIFLHSYEFQRIGTFPDDPQDPQTPWGNSPYPLVKNIAGPFFAPFLALTTDFGYFDRLTFGAGVFGPPAIGNRTFPLGVAGKPAASRYDFVQSRSTLIYPTVSAGFRVTKWLDIGVSGHVVLANFDQTTVSYTDLGPEVCKVNEVDGENKNEDFRCDSRSTLQASGTSFAATLGAMIRPSASFALGASFRTPTNINAVGLVTPTAPRVLPEGQDLEPGAASLALQLPWALRVGGRYIGMDADFELYDLELDITYEGWGTAQALGPIVTVPDLGVFKDVQTIVQHGYNNTIGLRAGGAYNIDTGDGLLSLRGGAYFDSSATDFQNTRLDFDTLAKVAGTFGVGYKVGSFGVDLGYAAVASIPRTVGTGQGDIRPVNGAANGAPEDAAGDLLPAVNEGSYRGFTHIVSLGVSVSIDSFFGPPRPVRYGNSYEPYYVPPGEEPEESKPAAIEKKPDADRDDDEPEEKKPEEKKPERRPPPDDDRPEVKKPAKPPPPPPPPDDDEEEEEEEEEDEVPAVKRPPPPPPPPKPDKPPTRRKEWWEEPE